MASESELKKKKVGYYVLGLTLGEGSFTTVRIGTHLLAREKMAVKILPKSLAVRQQTAGRNFKREALVLQSTAHPNIARLYEAMETPNSYYLVYELAGKGNLSTYVMNKKCLTEIEARRFMRQISSALDHLHQTSIVHRNLKLENILLTRSNLDIKIVDFGVSSWCQPTERTLRTQCGSPAYAAPEMFSSRRYGPEVDLWSIGVCLYAMVTGQLPFLSDPSSDLQQLHAVILRGAAVPAFFTSDLQELLRGLLEVQENKRLTAYDVIRHPWITLKGSQPIKRYPPASKLLPHAIDTDVIKQMTTAFHFSESDVIHSVLERKLNASAATYHLMLKRRLEGQKVNVAINKSCSENGPLILLGKNSDLDARQSSSVDSEVSGLQVDNKVANDVKSYKDCIRHLKKVRHKVILNGGYSELIHRNGHVYTQNQSKDGSKKENERSLLPVLRDVNPNNKSIKPFPLQSQNPAECNPLHFVHRHFGQNASFKVLGKSSAFLTKSGFGLDETPNSQTHKQHTLENMNIISIHPPEAPPNTANGIRTPFSNHEFGCSYGIESSIRTYLTSSSLVLKDPYSRKTWCSMNQQEASISGDHQAHDQKGEVMTFALPSTISQVPTYAEEEDKPSQKSSSLKIKPSASNLSFKRRAILASGSSFESKLESRHHSHHDSIYHSGSLTPVGDSSQRNTPVTVLSDVSFSDKLEQEETFTPITRITITSTAKL